MRFFLRQPLSFGFFHSPSAPANHDHHQQEDLQHHGATGIDHHILPSGRAGRIETLMELV
jgi:hypothetical protein